MSQKTGQRCVRSAAGQCFGPVVFPSVHLETFSILENKLIGYADDSTLIAVVPSPGVPVTVAESLNRDPYRAITRRSSYGSRVPEP